ncbi:MAG: class I SAM-dependent methyltransferase family protein [Methanomassiliicoccales archaeon]|nr:class I SAM-dependent methyltransferase family protein [Methanomassiliicoccales archaeon]
MRLAKVPRDRAEQVRKRITAMGGLRKDVRIFEEGGHVLIPLVEGFDETKALKLGAEVVEGDARSRACYVSPQEQARRLLSLPRYLEGYLPSKWEMFGDVLVLRIPRELAGIREKVAEAYAQVLGARTVCQERGVISGAHRTPDVEVIWGDGTETVHRENYILYRFDVARIMYSSGNFPEKWRMSRMDCRGETVVDMFAGIGYFTLPLAKHARAERVVACEINPVAYGYLVENISLNGVEGAVEPVLGDNRDLPGERLAHRVLMGYVGTTHEFLPKAFSMVRPGGVIHYHETCPIDEWPSRPLRRIGEAAGGRRWEAVHKGEVKSFAPSVSHYVVDVMVLD